MNNLSLVGVINEDPFDPLTWSGSSRFFFRALKEEGVLVDAISADPGGLCKGIAQIMSFSPKLNEWKRKYHLSTYLFKQMSKRAAKKLMAIQEGFDAILQVGAWYDLLDCKHLQDKFFFSYHDGNLATQLKRPDVSFDLDARYIQKALDFEKRLYNGLDLIFAMSEWLRTSFVEDFGCDPDKVVAVGAGVNLKHIPEIPSKDYSKKNILFIGVDFERKGGRIILDAYKIVKKEIPDATLTIIGPHINNLPDGAVSLGRIMKNNPKGEKKLHQAYLEATIFVMPSFYEPFGIVFGEAMAHKLPCIGTDTCAMPEIIDNGKSGFIVPPGNSKILGNRIIDLFRNEKELQRFGEAGYRKYLDNYTWKRVSQKIANAISNKFG